MSYRRSRQTSELSRISTAQTSLKVCIIDFMRDETKSVIHLFLTVGVQLELAQNVIGDLAQ